MSGKAGRLEPPVSFLVNGVVVLMTIAWMWKVKLREVR